MEVVVLSVKTGKCWANSAPTAWTDESISSTRLLQSSDHCWLNLCSLQLKKVTGTRRSANNKNWQWVQVREASGWLKSAKMIFRSDLSSRHVARHRQLGGHCISSRNAQQQARPWHTPGRCSTATFPWESRTEQVSGEVTQLWKDAANSIFFWTGINLLPSPNNGCYNKHHSVYAWDKYGTRT